MSRFFAAAGLRLDLDAFAFLRVMIFPRGSPVAFSLTRSLLHLPLLHNNVFSRDSGLRVDAAVKLQGPFPPLEKHSRKGRKRPPFIDYIFLRGFII